MTDAGGTLGGLPFLPVDTPQWERVIIYAVLGCVLLLVAKATSLGVMSLLDDSTSGRVRRPQRLGPKDTPLTLGTLPAGDALVRAAYLRAGVDGAADAILAVSASEGWVLKGDAPRTLSLFDVPRSASLRSAKLRAMLPVEAPLTEARAAARKLAEDEAGRLEEALLDQGLLRGGGSVFLGLAAHFAVSAALVLIGVFEAVLAGERGDVVAVPIAMAVAFGAVAIAIARPERHSHAGTRYLSWLEGATMAAAEDVESSRSTRGSDLSLVGAVAGIERVPLFRKCLEESRALTDA